MTLASWDETSSKAAAANPKTSKEVLDYFINPREPAAGFAYRCCWKIHLSVMDALVDLMAAATKEVVEVMLKSPRIKRSPRLDGRTEKKPASSGARKVEKVEEKAAVAPAAPPENRNCCRACP